MKTLLRIAMLLTLTAALCLCLGGVVYADGTVTASGTCGAQGDNLTWTLYDTGLLEIEGTGAMADYKSNGAPWYGSRRQITSAEIGDGVTSIGWSAFNYCLRPSRSLRV